MNHMQLYAPAKINLSLEIKGRRQDGFHEIETLMAPISLADHLTLKKTKDRGGIAFSCNDSSLPTDGRNLVIRAARLFQEFATPEDGIEITLEKNIPHGAGLGGGSSDAAMTLLGLNELFGAKIDQKSLIEWGSRIGSDVPFFMVGSAAICRGRGEIVEPASLPTKLNLLLMKPDFGVPTPWAYSRWKASRELPGINYGPQLFSGLRFVNDLERPVFEKYVVLGHLKRWLCEQGEVGAALLSGSGSTVFAVLREGAEADRLAAHVRENIDSEIWTHSCNTV